MATGDKIQLSREMEKISLAKTLAQGGNHKLDLALLAAEAIIIELDPKLNFVCEQWESLNLIEPLASILGINDLVINGRHIDVRVTTDDNYVSIAKPLVGSSLLTSGSLIVKLEQSEPDNLASIIGYVPASTWSQLKEQDGVVSLKVDVEPDFDLIATLKSIFKRLQTDQAPEKKPTREELRSFLQSPASSSSLRTIIAALCFNQETRDMACELSQDATISMPLNTVIAVLQKAAAWNFTCENIASSLSSQFKNVKPAEIKKLVQTLGERFGGQPESTEFMNAILAEVVQAEMSNKFKSTQALKERVKTLTSKLARGASLNDSVKAIINNPVAVDIAFAIKETRNQFSVSKLEKFVDATVEEIGGAFQKLALQPVYATHSKENEAGVDSINEALELLEAHDIIERAEAIKRSGF